MKRILSIANGFALIVTIVINYFSNTGMWNGNTMKTLSDKYFNYFTPAGYAFSIWGVIYFGLLGFVFYSGRNSFKNNEEDSILLKIGWWFVLSCFANSVWIVAWLHDYTGLSIFIMVLIFISLLKIIINTRMELDEYPFEKYVFIFWPFALYSGWISVALIANVAAFLTKVNWNGWGISDETWTIIMICIAGLINVFMVRLQNVFVYGLAGIWAILAISISHIKHSGITSIIYTCYVVAGILFVFIAICAFKKRQGSFNSM